MTAAYVCVAKDDDIMATISLGQVNCLSSPPSSNLVSKILNFGEAFQTKIIIIKKLVKATAFPLNSSWFGYPKYNS